MVLPFEFVRAEKKSGQKSFNCGEQKACDSVPTLEIGVMLAESSIGPTLAHLILSDYWGTVCGLGSCCVCDAHLV